MTDREIVLLVGVICCILALCLFGVGMGIYQDKCYLVATHLFATSNVLKMMTYGEKI